MTLDNKKTFLYQVFVLLQKEFMNIMYKNLQFVLNQNHLHQSIISP